MSLDTSDAFAGGEGGLSAFVMNDNAGKRRWAPTWKEAKLLLIASTGFFIDAYDLFTINLIVPMLNIQYNNNISSSLMHAALAGGVLKAAANMGCIVGQIGFGLLADVFGRRRVYPCGLIVAMFGVVMTVATPLHFGPHSAIVWITIWRVIMGIGIGGDYPMSASVVSDRANLNRRGTLLAFVFAMQGWGNLFGGVVTIIVLAAFRESIFVQSETSQFNAVWRIVIGVILVPCFGTLYQRITLPESARMKATLALREDPNILLKRANQPRDSFSDFKKGSTEGNTVSERDVAVVVGLGAKGAATKRSAAFAEFLEYFSEWRHLKHLIGTAVSWFLVDIAFYGISLNQSIVISAIGYNKAKNPWQSVFDNTKANLIISVAGLLPGYYATMFLVEYLGRKPIQIGGFLLSGLFLGIVAGDFAGLKSRGAAFIACFALLQFFFNFGPNATTFIYPAEVFPIRVRGFAHGFSAASGKCGAVISGLAFSKLASSIGTANVLWILCGCSVLGAVSSLLLPETMGYDADAIDLRERQEKLAAQGRRYY